MDRLAELAAAPSPRAEAAALRLDHILSFTNGPIEDALAEYRRAGFDLQPGTLRHPPGLRNGFVSFGPEYVELNWVEDEQAFAVGAPVWQQAQRRCQLPFAISFFSDDVHQLGGALAQRGYHLPPVGSRSQREIYPDGRPVWSFLLMPPGLLPGTGSFATTYHQPQEPRHRIRLADNSIYGLAGISLVSPAAAKRCHRWHEVLAAGASAIGGEAGRRGVADDSGVVTIGPHFARFLTPEEYRRRYSLEWNDAGPFLEIAVVHLWADDLARARKVLSDGGRQVVLAADELLLPANGRDGFVFSVAERPIRDWIAWRRSITGEALQLE